VGGGGGQGKTQVVDLVNSILFFPLFLYR
jgi:hypothetical protein